MRSLVLCGATILGLLLSPGVTYAGENECTAKIDGTLMRKEGKETETVYTAKVDVSVEASCSVVKFDLVVVEEVSGGERSEGRVSKEVRLNGSSPTSIKVDYKLERGKTVVEHRFEQTSCVLCEGA